MVYIERVSELPHLLKAYEAYKAEVMARAAMRARVVLLPFAEWLAAYRPKLWA